MKKIILLILLFTATLANSQVPYTPFEFENSTWKEVYYTVWFSIKYSDTFVEGDTIINNATYYKLREQGMIYFFDDPWQNEITDSAIVDRYLGAIRENDQRHVEYIPENLNFVYPIYDFNITMGDTVPVLDFASSPPFFASVIDMDTVEFCGTMRNRYTLKKINTPLSPPIYWVEGIGSTAGIIPKYQLFELGAELICYSNENCLCNDVINSSQEPDKRKHPFNIFPNPVDDELYIYSDLKSQNYRLQIFDLYGHQVFEKQVSTAQTSIQCDFLNNGAYILTLSGADWEYSNKLLILH